MKRIGKILALLLVLVLGITACGDSHQETMFNKGTKDSSYVKEKGTLIVGITEFVPLDYKKEDSWVGFDADLAREFARELGVSVEFCEIEWENKEDVLAEGRIDCVWNGMTLTEEVKESMSCSKPYLNNAQVVIVAKSRAQECQLEEDCMHYLFAVESGSAGEKELNRRNYRYTPVKTQKEALEQVRKGRADVAIVDSILAAAMVGEGTSYPDLTYTVSLSDEEFGVGFRQESDLTELLNKFLEQKKQDGTIDKIAKQYGVQAALL